MAAWWNNGAFIQGRGACGNKYLVNVERARMKTRHKLSVYREALIVFSLSPFEAKLPYRDGQYGWKKPTAD